MLDVNYLEANTEEAIKRLNSRGEDYGSLVNEIIHLNKLRKIGLLIIGRKLARKNKLTRDMKNFKFELEAMHKNHQAEKEGLEQLLSIDREINSLKMGKNFLKSNAYLNGTKKHNQTMKEVLIEKIKILDKLEESIKDLLSSFNNWKNRIENLNTEIDSKLKELKDINFKIEKINKILPNIPAPDVPIGKNESENVEIKKIKNPKISPKEILSHWEIAKKLNWVDFELGTKLSGSRFLVYRGLGAKMIRVLADVLLSFHTQNGYVEFNVPLIVNKESMEGTGQLPKFKTDSYETGTQYLIPTGEVPLTNFVSNELLDYKQLPLNLTTFTPCFRQEAGAAGRDTKGFIRLHQFNKVELVKIVSSESSDKEFDNLVNEVKKVLNLFGLPYRIVNLVTGDLGFSSRKTYDFEIWFPSQNKYREISSCSQCGDFQARNMKARYRDENGKIKFVNTLNGSGVAIDRLFAAILENNWNGKRLKLPKILQPYFENQKYLQ